MVEAGGVGVSLCLGQVEPSSIDPRCTCTRNKLQRLRSNLVSTTQTGTCRGTKSLFVRGKGWLIHEKVFEPPPPSLPSLPAANPIDATRRYCTAPALRSTQYIPLVEDKGWEVGDVILVLLYRVVGGNAGGGGDGWEIHSSRVS